MLCINPKTLLMKTLITLAFLFFVKVIAADAQDLLGAWRMISVRGTEPDGRKFQFDDTMVKETKLITANHYIIISQDAKSDSLLLGQSSAGDVKISGQKYQETPTTSILKLTSKAGAVFVWKVDHDLLTMSGTVTLANGQKVTVDELRYRRIKLEQK